MYAMRLPSSSSSWHKRTSLIITNRNVHLLTTNWSSLSGQSFINNFPIHVFYHHKTKNNATSYQSIFYCALDESSLILANLSKFSTVVTIGKNISSSQVTPGRILLWLASVFWKEWSQLLCNDINVKTLIWHHLLITCVLIFSTGHIHLISQINKTGHLMKPYSEVIV